MIEDFHYPAEKYLLLGKIAKAHGMRGEVKVFLHSGQPENIRNYKELFLIDLTGCIQGPISVRRSRDQGKFAIIELASVTNRSEAEQIEGRGILLPKADLPEISEGEYYWYQYLGKAVVDVTGKNLGKVQYLFRNGPQDVLVVKNADSGEEVLIPVTKEIIIGETAGELIIDPPPGLLELNAGP